MLNPTCLTGYDWAVDASRPLMTEYPSFPSPSISVIYIKRNADRDNRIICRNFEIKYARHAKGARNVDSLIVTVVVVHTNKNMEIFAFYFRRSSLILGFGSILLVATLLIVGFEAYPVHHMRICIQSSDPSRLASQCVYCKTRPFPLTVRLCTGNTYLPARMTVNEAYCLTTTCRRQLPRLPAEPYAGGSSMGTNAVNTNSIAGSGGGDEMSSNGGFPSANGEPNGDENYEEAESQSLAQQPTKVRLPAKFVVGKPHKKPTRPFLFG